MATILLVEDDKAQQLLYANELQEEGHYVLTAATGPEALEKLGGNGVDLVVLDLLLPSMNGLETLGRMLEVKRDLKVVINTAYSQYRHNFASWGADAYLIKSSDLGELKQTITQLLRDR